MTCTMRLGTICDRCCVCNGRINCISFLTVNNSHAVQYHMPELTKIPVLISFKVGYSEDTWVHQAMASHAAIRITPWGLAIFGNYCTTHTPFQGYAHTLLPWQQCRAMHSPKEAGRNKEYFPSYPWQGFPGVHSVLACAFNHMGNGRPTLF